MLGLTKVLSKLITIGLIVTCILGMELMESINAIPPIFADRRFTEALYGGFGWHRKEVTAIFGADTIKDYHIVSLPINGR